MNEIEFDNKMKLYLKFFLGNCDDTLFYILNNLCFTINKFSIVKIKALNVNNFNWTVTLLQI